jgi:hypothetical protein
MVPEMVPEMAPETYPMAPLIRFTLIGLYLALVLPLPALAPPQLRPWLLLALPIGLAVVVALTSERVVLDGEGIHVGHPPWCRWLLRRGWQLSWEAITGLTPVATSQGGRVFYLRTAAGAYLLPQRVSQFPQFLERFQAATGLNTQAIGRISPPWTYQVLAGLTALMLACEAAAAWAVATGRWDFPPVVAG